MTAPSYGRLASLGLLAINVAGVTFMIVHSGFVAGMAWVLVIGLHELGHAVVARYLGARIVKILLIPYVGGLTLGPIRSNLDGRAAFTLGGVALSAVAAVLLLTASAAVPGDAGVWLASLAAAMAWINLLNLLPVSPLDGGRLVVLTTTAWSVWVGHTVRGFMLAFLVYWAVKTGAWLIWVIIAISAPVFLIELRFASAKPERTSSDPAEGRRAWLWLGLYVLHIVLFLGILTASVGHPGAAVRVGEALLF